MPMPRLFLLTLAILVSAETSVAGSMTLLVNGRAEPLGISRKGISFSWIDRDTNGPNTPKKYQLRVRESTEDAPVWESAIVDDQQQTGLALPGSVELKPATTYRWYVRSWTAQAAGEWSEGGTFETGIEESADWQGARWISDSAKEDAPGAPATSLPVFRRTFHPKGEVVRARIYATARGLYRLSLNGEKVGDQFLSPGWTDYAKKFQVQTYDVTKALKAGPTTLDVSMGDGWFRGKVGLGWTKVYGEKLALLLYLSIEYKDGTHERIVTDENWRCLNGPFTRADLQEGEVYDARAEVDPFSDPFSTGSPWRPVELVGSTQAEVIPQPDEPVHLLKSIKPVSMEKLASGAYRIDFGQNMVGVVRLRITGERGQTIVLRHAEEVYREGPRKGTLYTENLRGAAAEDHYTFGQAGTVTYEPTFTQHGFRYVEITGLTLPLGSSDIEGIVRGSDLREIGTLETSSPLLNQLVSNIRWGQRGNFVSIPTDTPARDERLGWTGDIAVFAPTACRLTDSRAFLSKWLDDVADAQRPDGNIPAIVPQPRREFDETGVGWADAVIQVPYAVWKASGDLTFLRRHWPTVRKMYSFIHDSATKDGDFLEQGRASWFSGDWLSLETVDRLAEHPVIATAYLANDSAQMSEMAAALGEVDFSQSCATIQRQASDAFTKNYVSAEGTVRPGTQTVYAMALGMGLIRDESLLKRVATKFVAKLESDQFHLRTGFLGTPWLLPALSAIGRDDLAMRLLLNEDYPSWGYEVRMGATTVWERWNSIRDDGTFGPVEMNSFNHYAYGAVLDWMFERVGGIKILEPGYRKVRIHPIVTDPRVTHASSRIDTPYGMLSCKWSSVSGRIHYELTIPPGCSAEFVLPESIRAGTRDTLFKGNRGASWISTARALLGSGEFKFDVELEAQHSLADAGEVRAREWERNPPDLS